MRLCDIRAIWAFVFTTTDMPIGIIASVAGAANIAIGMMSLTTTIMALTGTESGLHSNFDSLRGGPSQAVLR